MERGIVGQLPNPMTLTFTLLALTFILSFGLLLLNILSAPEGYEDEAGFHAAAESEVNIYGLVAGNQSKTIPVYVKSVTQHGLV